MSQRMSVVVVARTAVRDAIRTSLTAAGFVIAAEAGDAAEAMAAVASRRPRVCVLDRGLPDGGLSTIAALAQPGHRPRLLVVGGDTRAADVRAARLAGADECLPGAIDAERVVAAVSELAGDPKGET